jgi:hypothetical protein
MEYVDEDQFSIWEIEESLHNKSVLTNDKDYNSKKKEFNEWYNNLKSKRPFNNSIMPHQ